MNLQAMAKRQEEVKWARKLQEVLGNDFRVSYDTCESGMTDVYYKGILYKTVRNEEMRHDMNVYDYTPDYNWKMAHGFNIFG